MPCQVIAWYDYIKSELPDVLLCPGPKRKQSVSAQLRGDSLSGDAPPTPTISATSSFRSGIQSWVRWRTVATATAIQPIRRSAPPGTGIIWRVLLGGGRALQEPGLPPTGYDGIDNDKDGLIDNWNEGVQTGVNDTLVANHLASHTHITARSEMLYALLVEGPRTAGLGLQPRRLHGQEVQDTDNDGLPEFVDAWGQPLQFFRWPLLYPFRHPARARTIARVFVPDHSPAALRDRVRDARARPAGPQSAAHGTGLVVRYGVVAMTISRWRCLEPLRDINGASSGVQAFESFFHPLT